MFARTFVTIFGLACASASALIFLPIAALFDPYLQATVGGVSPEHWMELFAAFLNDDAPEETLTAMFHLVWTIAMLVCILPVTIVALIGAVSQARAYVFYAGATGVLAAAMPWIVRAGRLGERSTSITAAEGHVALVLFLTGVVAGTVYWAIAARGVSSPGNPQGWSGRQSSG